MILVTGFNGQLGYDVVKELKQRNIECLGIDKEELLPEVTIGGVATYMERADQANTNLFI